MTPSRKQQIEQQTKERYPGYKYLGDRFTDPMYKGQTCEAVRRPDGKCIRGKNGNMLVSFNGKPVIVVARLLRKIVPLIIIILSLTSCRSYRIDKNNGCHQTWKREQKFKS